MPIAIMGQNIADWQAVAQQEFGYPMDGAPSHTAAVLLGRGGMEPWQEKVNIVGPQSVPAGSQMVLNPYNPYSPLMGN